MNTSIDKIVLWQLRHRLWIYSEKSTEILPKNMLLPSEALMPKKKRTRAQIRRDARCSDDVPSTDDENVVSDDSIQQDFNIETSSDESVWSMWRTHCAFWIRTWRSSSSYWETSDFSLGRFHACEIVGHAYRWCAMEPFLLWFRVFDLSLPETELRSALIFYTKSSVSDKLY